MFRAVVLAFLFLLLATPALATGISDAPPGSAPPLGEVPVIPILPFPASGLDIPTDLGVPPGPPVGLPPGPPTGLPPVGDLPPELALPPGPPAGLPVGPPEGLPPIGDLPPDLGLPPGPPVSLPPHFVTTLPGQRDLVATPEPGTGLLLASGLIGLAINGRRRKI
jgi:hypothetical protein